MSCRLSWWSRFYYRYLITTLICLMLTGVAFPTVVLAQQGEIKTPAERMGLETAPLILDSDTLFNLRGATSFPAQQRVALVKGRIIQVANDKSFDVKDLLVLEEADRSSIRAGDFTIVSVLDADAELESLNRQLVASLYRDAIAKGITNYRQARTVAHLTEQSMFALGFTVVLIVLLWVSRLLFGWFDRWIDRHIGKGIDELASKSHYLLRANTLWSIIGGLLRLLRTVLYLTLAYFYLNTVLGLFPWTRPLAIVLFNLILDPLSSLALGFVSQLPNLAFLVVLWFVVRYLLKLMHMFFIGVEFGRIKIQDFDPDWALPTYKILRVVAVALALVIAYPYIPGSESAAFKGVSVFFGLLLSLGSSSFIANMIAGLSMTYRGAFKAGDLIKVGDVVGTVRDMKLMVTRVRTLKNEIVILPNSNILNTEIINYSLLAREEGVVLHSTVGIGYDTPWRQVESLLLESAARTEGLKSEPKPFVLQSSLGDFAVQYEINAYCADVNRMPALYSALHANIQDLFNEHGVQIMSPAYISDPDTPKLVPPEKWYTAPAKQPE